MWYLRALKLRKTEENKKTAAGTENGVSVTGYYDRFVIYRPAGDIDGTKPASAAPLRREQERYTDSRRGNADG